MDLSHRSSSSFTSPHIQNITTEGWLELFLTLPQKRSFSQWKETVQNRSLTHKLTSNHMESIATKVPENVTPNLITLSGFICLGQAWYVTNKYGETHPIACTWFAVLNILIYFFTHSIDLRHAERIRQRSALGNLFKYVCDCNATVFLAIVTTYCLGGTDVIVQWYVVQATQLVLFTKHLSAFHRHAGLRYNVLTGPGDVLALAMILLCVRGIFGLDLFLKIYEGTFHPLVAAMEEWHSVVFPDQEAVLLPKLKDKIYEDPMRLGAEAVMAAYYAMYVTAIIKTLMLSKKEHGWSRFGVSASLLMRLFPAVFLRMGQMSGDFELMTVDVIVDGIFMALLTSDVMLAKMADREIHPWVVTMSLCAALSHSTILTLVAVYYIAVFADLCSYLNMPLLTVCKNVYCDGVFDLCHIGHKTLFRNALTYGNRLYVGVVGDEDATSYKRPPIMTHDERCEEVEACKSVTKVIQNCPCFGLTQEFLDEHQIHVVAYGQEYQDRYPNTDDDPYYGYVRKIGIAKPLPRHDGLSTSDLISRIQKSRPGNQRNDE